MKQPIPTIILPALWVVFSLLLGGCADMDGNVHCLYDSNCPGDEYCVESICRDSCALDEDCLDTSTCEAYQRAGEASPIQVCLDPTTNQSDASVECEDDQFCRELFDDPQASCGIHQYCVRPGGDNDNQDHSENQPNGGEENGDNSNQNQVTPPPYQILILEQLNADGTTGDEEEVLPVPLPLRVGAVIARDADNMVRAYGELIRFEDHPDAYGSLGQTPLLLNEEETCVAEPTLAPYISLGGPGGRAFIRFLAGSGDLGFVEESWHLEILAEGPKCPLGPLREHDDTGGDSDAPLGTFRALLCVSDTEFPDLDIDCPIQVSGPLSAFTDLEVTFPS